MKVDLDALFLLLNRSRFVPGSPSAEPFLGRHVRKARLLEFNWDKIKPSLVRPWGVLAWVAPEVFGNLEGALADRGFLVWVPPDPQREFWTVETRRPTCITRSTVRNPATGLWDEPDVRWLPE